jgi:hypothetical protein
MAEFSGPNASSPETVTMNLDDATLRLYAEPPAGFTARRSELAAEALREDNRELAELVKQLRKPTVAAWLVNQLARSGSDLEELLDLGDRMRQAQANMDGRRMTELGRERQQLIPRLLRRARAVAAGHGQSWTAGLEREVEATVVAAMADARAAAAVASGKLTRALSYAGLGEVDVTDATATPPAPPADRPPTDGAAADAVLEARRQEAARDTAAEKEAATALADARARAEELTRVVHAAERELDALRRDLGRAGRDVEEAEAAHRAASERASASRAALAGS